MEVSGHFQTPANLCLGNNFSTHLTGEVDPEPGWTVLKSTKTLAPVTIRALVIQPIASRHTDYTILAP